ncbi:MAG: hypothetical protein EOP20_00810 [Hyphomicrobiales bacterium]|nr:MAG: hypothetical protein EOP20_00810 [Hyphomicrobiales bacterium]
MSALAELLARVEAATGPDAEIDARLHHTLFPDAEVLLDPGDVRTRRPSKRGALREVSLEGWEDFEGLARHFGAERYSALTDAAFDLAERVLPKFDASHGKLIWTHGLHSERTWLCEMRWYRAKGRGATAPLAIVSAIIRAVLARDTASPVHPQGS